MKLTMTVVVDSDTEELILVTESTSSLADLWWKIDELTDPNKCKYADIDIEQKISLTFPKNLKDFDGDFDDHLFSAQINTELLTDIENEVNEIIDWVEIGGNINFELVSDIDRELMFDVF
jgi:hypothetical protein